MMNLNTFEKRRVGPLFRKTQCRNPLKSHLQSWIRETDLKLPACRLVNKAFSFLKIWCRDAGFSAHRTASPGSR